MNFIKSVRYLRGLGVDVRPSATFSNGKRMYFFQDDEDDSPEILLSMKALNDYVWMLLTSMI